MELHSTEMGKIACGIALVGERGNSILGMLCVRRCPVDSEMLSQRRAWCFQGPEIPECLELTD